MPKYLHARLAIVTLGNFSERNFSNSCISHNAESGAKSRPSPNRCRNTETSLGIRANIFLRCESIACTPPGQNNCRIWRLELFFLQCSIHCFSSGNFAKLPSSNMSCIWTRYCLMILPVPIVMCPTSEFPICPSGNHTALPEASN